MARYKLILAYDGGGFAGSQRQSASARSRTGKRRTVQAELEAALRRLGWSGRAVLLAGRTDAGVHASGQVAAVDLDWKHDPQALRQALNSHLPADMAVREVQAVAADFHPRFDATSRCYRYTLFFQQVRDPLSERYAWRVWPAFDARLLSEVAADFVGSHDFGAFGSSPTRSGSTFRTLSSARWYPLDGERRWQFEVMAESFLYRMVRRLVFVQVAVAQGRCSRASVVKALERGAQSAPLPAGLAPAHGLELVQVDYGPARSAIT